MNRLFNLAAAASFAVMSSGCATPPADLDVRMSKPSTDGRYLVSMRQLERNPAINRLHAWEVSVKTSSQASLSTTRASAFPAACPSITTAFPPSRM
ncbi:hypothetical protein LP420_06140 [Massilia sp. B-10]|nr:hypothetical protein LP420_06140 [Massilia sp. B-10]